MKTNNSRQNLLKAFGIETWSEFQSLLEEAKGPFPVTMSWKCIAKGKKRNGHACIVNEGIKENPATNASYVSEEFTYIRFDEDLRIWRFQNPLEMKHELREFDASGLTNLEEGDVFVLEPVGLARSLAYAKKRREDIASGKHTVKPRGPNPNMRRQPKHHFRPY
jgi:hypothetical protein